MDFLGTKYGTYKFHIYILKYHISVTHLGTKIVYFSSTFGNIFGYKNNIFVYHI